MAGAGMVSFRWAEAYFSESSLGKLEYKPNLIHHPNENVEPI
jgi:hypothetical protein